MLWLRIPFYIGGLLLQKAGKQSLENYVTGKKVGVVKESKQHKKKADVTGRAVEAAIITGKTMVEALAKRPGIQASVDSLKMKLTTGEAEKYEILDKVYRNADTCIALLKSNGVNLKRLAVDGVPGSGKSSLARALAERLNFKVITLDYIDLNKPLNFSQEKVVYEHHRLIRTQAIDVFDAIIYIDEPVKLSKEKCIYRKRGGINIDVFDYDKLKKIGKTAFESAGGKMYLIPGCYIKLKIRLLCGFMDYDNIRDKVKRKGFKTKGRSKEELLFLYVYGKAHNGLKAYINLSTYNKEMKEGIYAGISRFFMT